MELYQPLRRLIKILLLLTVFLIPLSGASGNFGYEQSKVLFFIFLISLSGFVWFIYLLKNPQFKWTGIAKAGGLFTLVLLAASILGVNPRQSFLGADPYFQGWILYAYFFLFFLLVSSARIKLEHWTYALTGSASIVALLAIGQWVQVNLLGHMLPTYAGRVVSTFGQPNFYAGFILLTLPFFRLALQGRTLRTWWIVGFLISILAIIISESRIAYLLLAMLLLWWLIWELPFKRLILSISAVIVLIIFVFSIFFGAGFLEKEFKVPSQTLNPDLPTIGVEKRYYFWPILGQLILQKPIHGYGLENIALVFFRYFEVNKHTLFEENLKVKPYLFGLKDLYLDRSHNYPLDLLLFSGILGLIGWLGIVLLLFKKLQKSHGRGKNVLITSLVIYLVWIQFQNQSVVHLMYFWLIAGIISSPWLKEKLEDKDRKEEKKED